MQDLKVGDYIHVVKKGSQRVEEFYATVEDVVRDEVTGQFQIAIVRPDGGRAHRIVFAHNKITLVNLIEANE